MKRTLSLLVVLLMVVALVAGCSSGGSSSGGTTGGSTSQAGSASTGGTTGGSDEGPIKIGTFIPVTGVYAQIGEACMNSLNMLVEDINAGGGILGREVQLISYDGKGSPEEVVKVTTRMIESDGVHAIIASALTSDAMAVADIVEEAQIPLIAGGLTPTLAGAAGGYFFRSSLNTTNQLLSVMDICEQLNLKSMAILHSQDEFGTNGKDTMVSLCEEYNMEMVTIESIKPGDSDMTAQCTNIATSNPDTVYVIATIDNVPAIVKQLRANGFTGYIVGGTDLGAPEIKDVAGAAADLRCFGVPFLMPINSPDEAKEGIVRDFFQQYYDKYGKMLDTEVGARAYDGLLVLQRGFEDAGTTDGPTLRDAIDNIEGLEGIQGTYNFKGNNGEGLTKAELYITYEGVEITLNEYLEQTK